MLASISEDSIPKQSFSQEWNKKPCIDKQRKTCSRAVDDLLHYVYIDKTECLQEVEGRDSLAASFMSSVWECVSERECKLYDEGRNNKVKLALYKIFIKVHTGVGRPPNVVRPTEHAELRLRSSHQYRVSEGVAAQGVLDGVVPQTNLNARFKQHHTCTVQK